jgi:hypothetical protein
LEATNAQSIPKPAYWLDPALSGIFLAGLLNKKPQGMFLIEEDDVTSHIWSMHFNFIEIP